MRWFHVDRFEVLERNEYARAVKCASLGEEHLHDHFAGYPVVPAALNIETMAQTAGVLAVYTYDFKKNVILAKVEKAEFPRLVRPGDKMIVEAWIDEIKPEGCWTHAQITVYNSISKSRISVNVWRMYSSTTCNYNFQGTSYW